MSNTRLSHTDKKNLLKLAGSLPKGDKLRRVILGELSADVLVYGNKERHGSFFLTAFSFGSTGPEDDARFLKILKEETIQATHREMYLAKPRLTDSKDGVLTVWWSQNNFSDPNAMDDDSTDVEAYSYFEDLMDHAFKETAKRMGLSRVKKLGHSADVRAQASAKSEGGLPF